MPDGKLTEEQLNADYGCYFYIDNGTDTTLTREDDGWAANSGEWVGEPPKYIGSMKTSPIMHIKDNLGLLGSNGYVTYDARGESIKFEIACPTVGSNSMTATSSAGTNSRFLLEVPNPIPSGAPLDNGAIFRIMDNPKYQ